LTFSGGDAAAATLADVPFEEVSSWRPPFFFFAFVGTDFSVSGKLEEFSVGEFLVCDFDSYAEFEEFWQQYLEGFSLDVGLQADVDQAFGGDSMADVTFFEEEFEAELGGELDGHFWEIGRMKKKREILVRGSAFSSFLLGF
jgi:hypothetical protein